jgi:hypothetical protein
MSVPDFVNSLIYEKLNKQIVSRIPYAAIVSFVVWIFANQQIEGYQLHLYIIAVITIIIFFANNTLFNRDINQRINRSLFADIGLKDGQTKLQDIMQGKISMLEDIMTLKNRYVFLPAVIGGGSLTIFFSLVILLFIDRIALNTEMAAVSIVITSIFVYYDLMKSPLQIGKFEDDKPDSTTFDIMEKYLLSNSNKAVPTASPTLLRFIGRVLGPVLELHIPKLTYSMIMVYSNKELRNKLLACCNSDGDDGIILKRIEGESMSYRIRGG